MRYKSIIGLKYIYTWLKGMKHWGAEFFFFFFLIALLILCQSPYNYQIFEAKSKIFGRLCIFPLIIISQLCRPDSSRFLKIICTHTTHTLFSKLSPQYMHPLITINVSILHIGYRICISYNGHTRNMSGDFLANDTLISYEAPNFCVQQKDQYSLFIIWQIFTWILVWNS